MGLFRALKPAFMMAPLLALCACRPTVDLGSFILWHADHEVGDMSEWTAGNGGGAMAPSMVATGEAHSGTHAVRVGLLNEVTLWRQGTFPQDCYYSAWFFLPVAFQEITSWTIMTFGSADLGDAGTRSEKTILNLRTLPGGDIVLFVFDDRVAYEQWPLAVPPAVVPVAKWFQIEVRYRNANDDTGRMTIWIDGVQVYDITHRPSGVTPGMYFGIGNVPDVVTPRADILMDDAVISLSRVTPKGVVPASP
jgi:hypothetical protein